MQAEYNRNKQKLDIKLQTKAIDTCIFVINKSDLLSSDKQKEKLKGKLKQYIIEVEPNIPSQWDNIAFFSGKCFNECLIYYKRYVEFLDTKPILLLKLLYKEWSKKFSILKISKAI